MHQVVEEDADRLAPRLSQEGGHLQLTQHQHEHDKPGDGERRPEHSPSGQPQPLEPSQTQESFHVPVPAAVQALNDAQHLVRHVEVPQPVGNREDGQTVVEE